MGDDGVKLVGKLRRELLNIRLTEPVTLPCSAEFSDEPFKKNPHRNHFFFRFDRPINRRLAIGRLAHSDSNEAHTAEANNTDEAATATTTATIKQTSA